MIVIQDYLMLSAWLIEKYDVIYNIPYNVGSVESYR